MMKSFWIFGLLVVNLLLIDAALELEWTGDENIDFSGESGIYTIAINEEEENVVIAYILNIDSDPTLQFYPSSSLDITGMEVKQNTDGKWELKVTKRQDYESDYKSFKFDVIYGTEITTVLLNIKNIDDQIPIVSSDNQQCSIQEDHCCDTTCVYKITDDDREMDKITWTINGQETHKYFKFAKSPGEADNELMLKLELNEPLDYQIAAIHVIDLTVKDTVHSTDFRIVINVGDIPNQDPVWVTIFQSRQFNEEDPQEFEIEAKDGDIDINDDIRYEIFFEENEDWKDIISIDQSDTNKALIKTNGIDRDHENKDIYKFTVKACEVTETPTACIEQDISFILNDINDNRPNFEIVPAPTVHNVVVLEIPENQITTINTKITVNDIDLGENARYTLILSGTHSSAFSVAPNSGYQDTSVELFIINPALLDFENPEWQQFSLTLKAIEQTDPVNEDVQHEPITFEITLLNRNDELPTFVKCNEVSGSIDDVCIIEVEETFNDPTEILVKIKAEDRDIGDKLKFELLGTYANQILRIDAETGDVFILDRGSRPFDYETLPEVLVQVQVKDSLEIDGETQHTALGQLTIKLTDVNDESPRITVESNADGVSENCGDGCDVGIQIIATDEDSEADLEIVIDWGASDAIKNGRKITDSEDFQKYKECVVLDFGQPEGPQTKQTKTARLKFKENEETKDNTPDFEIFDTLDLRIVVTDKNQRESESVPNYAQINIQIYINDENDNKPEFTSSIDATLTVAEETALDTLIGYITATDKDVGTELHYKLTPRENTPDGLVVINELSGELKTSGTIDADNGIEYLYYTVTVSDPDPAHDQSADIQIYVEDRNTKNPVFNNKDIPDIYIDEQAEEGTEVGTFEATDADRDPANNKITYSFSSNMDADLRNYFKIDSETGKVFVSYTNSEQKLDRDAGKPTPPITITIDAKDLGDRSDSLTVKVVLNDINNKEPVLVTQGPFTIGEDSGANVLIAELIASDDDEDKTDNSKVSFEIVKIEGEGNNEDPSDSIFVLSDPNETDRKVSLRTGVALRGYFGDYKVNITMSDHGEEPNTQNASFTVTINKYNFENPIFDFPIENQVIHLSKSQTPNMPLRDLQGGTLSALIANDGQGGKFIPTFSVSDEKNIFTIMENDYLTVKEADPDCKNCNIRIPITIKATTEGPPELSTEITVTMIFVDQNISPKFLNIENQEISMNDFLENQEAPQTFPFPAAEYEIDLDLDLKIYYIIEGESPFSIPNNQEPALQLDKELDREEECCYTVLVQAANQDIAVVNPDEKARLTINIELQDINDNPPKFERDIYYAILKYDDKQGEILVTVEATDPDIKDTITYKLQADNYPSSYPTLTIDPSTGDLKLARDSTSQATDYATVQIIAHDGDDDHDAKVNVEIYVISEDKHIINFKFNNELSEIEAKIDEIERILSGAFESPSGSTYQANMKRYIQESGDESRADGDIRTVCEMYFIDVDEHKPVEKSIIEAFASDVQTYKDLRNAFIQEGLDLISFSSSTEVEDNTVDVLRAWLIGVSVVLGTLCVLLIIAFVVKTRSLTNRLNKLSVIKYGSQESGLNRQVVPNTNRHALEGSNPVFSNEKIIPEEIDRKSISSGDSDLIGVENNPDFQHDSEKNGLPRY